MIFEDTKLAQLVIDPGDPLEAQQDAVLFGAFEMEAMWLTVGWPVLLRAKVLKRLHPLVHHFVVWKRYDPSSERLISVGMVCAYCSKARLG